MAHVANLAATQAYKILVEPSTGISTILAGLSEQEGIKIPGLLRDHVQVQNVSADLVEKSAGAKYPAVHIYCEKLTNTMREKFRAFSGKARMVVETRVSQDRLEGMEQSSQLMVDAVTEVLGTARGDWGQGAFYSGGYEVLFGPVKRGGRNFLQINKVVFDLDLSTD